MVKKLIILLFIILFSCQVSAAIELDENNDGAVDIPHGGTGAQTAAGIRANINVEDGAEANEPLVSQAAAEAGTSETEFSWSPLRIAQAIAALAVGGGGSTDPDDLDGDTVDDDKIDAAIIADLSGTYSEASHDHLGIYEPAGITESDISDLDHYSDSDIDGNESAFDGWDKDSSDDAVISDSAYDESAWDENTDAPSKNAVRDKFESLSGSFPGFDTLLADYGFGSTVLKLDGTYQTEPVTTESDPTVDSSAEIQAIIGADVYQAHDADLTTYAGITPSADGQALLASADANPFTDADESNLDNQSGMNTGDNPGYDSVDDIPHAAPSDGDTTHFPNCDEAYDYGTANYATAAQGATADTAVQPGDLGAVATSNDYDDLSNKPSIPDELSDLSDDATHRTVTDTEKSTWNGKQDALPATPLYASDFASVTDAKAVTGNNTGDQVLPTQSSLSVDDLISLSGVSEGATTLGTFTGSTIPDSQNNKQALQALETTVEGLGGGHDAVTLNASATTGGMSLSGQEISNQAATNAQNGYATSSHISAIEANTAKAANVSTALSAGTVTATTYGITSDGGTDDIVLPEADTNNAGLLGADKWDEIVANSLKDTFPGFTSLFADYGFTDNSSNWDTAYGWGDHSSQNYLDKDTDTYVETEVDSSTTNEIQTIDTSELDGTTLKLSLSSDGEADKEIDLSSLQDGTGTDDQIASEVNVTDSNSVMVGATVEDVLDEIRDTQDEALSPHIITGGAIETGTNAGTFKVTALTAKLRSTDSRTGSLVYVSLSEQDNQAITVAETEYIVHLDYNDGSPQIVINTANQYWSGNDYTMIPIGRVMKDGSDNVHYISGGYDFNDGLIDTHTYLKLSDGIKLMSGGGITYTGTNQFISAQGLVFGGLNPFTLSAYDSSSTNFIPLYSDGGVGYTEETPTGTIPYTKYDDGDGTPGDVANNKYSTFWIYRHVDDGDVYLRYGEGSYSLAEAEEEQMPSIPLHLSSFGCLIGKIICPKAGGSLTVQMATDNSFSGTAVADHAGLANLAWTTSGHTGTASRIAAFGGDGSAEEIDYSGWDQNASDDFTWDYDYSDLTGLSANVMSFLGGADYAALRALLDLEPGTDFYSMSAADSEFINATEMGTYCETTQDYLKTSENSDSDDDVSAADLGAASDNIANDGTIEWEDAGALDADGNLSTLPLYASDFASVTDAKATTGTNTGDQTDTDFDIKDLTDSTSLRSTWSAKLGPVGPVLNNGDTSAGYLDFLEDSDNGTNYLRLLGPPSCDTITVNLPSTAGTLLLTNGSAASLTSFPTLNQNTTGTAANLSGTPALPDGTTATTQSASDNSTKIATTAYVETAVAAGGGGWSGDSTLSTDHSYYGQTDSVTAGESVVFGDCLYKDYTDDEWYKASETATYTEVVQVICLETGSDGNSVDVLRMGYIRDDTYNWTVDNTKVMLWKGSSGAATETTPTTTGNWAQIVGTIDTDDTLFFNPQIMMIQVK